MTGFGERVGDPSLRARAGVVTGQAAAMEQPGEGLVVGDRVNTAARIQSAAEPGTVLVDEVTRQVTSAAVAYEPAGERSVKGKAEPLTVWHAVQVVAGVGGREREPAMEAPWSAETLTCACSRSCCTGRRSGVRPGWWRCRPRRGWVRHAYAGSFPATGRFGRPFPVALRPLPVLRRRRGLLGAGRDGAPAPGDQRGRRSGGGGGAARGRVGALDPRSRRSRVPVPRLGALLGAAEPGLGRDELFAGWRLFFERLAEREPVVLVFEDLQWADEGLLEFIEHVLEWSSSSPIFMLTLGRPELIARSDGWPPRRRGATFLQLEPLDDQAMGRLLDSLIDGLGDDARDRIVGQAEGVPLYAIEMVRSLVDRGVVTEHEGRLRADPGTG